MDFRCWRCFQEVYIKKLTSEQSRYGSSNKSVHEIDFSKQVRGEKFLCEECIKKYDKIEEEKREQQENELKEFLASKPKQKRRDVNG